MEETRTMTTSAGGVKAGTPPASDDVRAPDLLGPPVRNDEAIRKVADQPKQASPDDMQDALEWFLADDDTEADPVFPIELNVSTDPAVKQWITWHVKPMQSTRIDALRRTFQVAGNREQRRKGMGADLDAARFNAALVYEATVKPDLNVAIEQGKFVDGAQAVLHRFRNKPLLVDQIAGQILYISGGDDEDMRIPRELRAAGN